MATPKALFTPATWSEDDSDEEEHFREMVRLRIRHEERFRDVHDVNVPEHRPPDPIWGEPPRTAGAAPRSPDSDVDENADPWGDFGASPRRVIETPGDYPKQVCFMVWGDKIDQLQIREGQELTVHFDLESREYNGRWYTDVKAWKVDRDELWSKTKNTPFDERPVQGRVMATIVGGRTIYQDESFLTPARAA